MISPIKFCSLLSLSPGKFSGESETMMRLHSYEDEILYRFPRELDTQGLSTNSTTIRDHITNTINTLTPNPLQF